MKKEETMEKQKIRCKSRISVSFLIIICISMSCISLYSFSEDQKQQSALQRQLQGILESKKKTDSSSGTGQQNQQGKKEDSSMSLSVPTPTKQQSFSSQSLPMPPVDTSSMPPTDSSVPQSSLAPNTTQKDDTDSKAFSETKNQLLPMTPKQIKDLKKNYIDVQKAGTGNPNIPPKPIASSTKVNLEPNAVPPVIRLQSGYITSLVFMDSTGQAWPISSYSVGDPTAFNIQWDKKSNTMLVQATSLYKRSNLAVILNELDTPVMMTLMTGQSAVDYRVDLRIPRVGPNGLIERGSGLPDVENPSLIDVLNGIKPIGSKKLKCNNPNCTVWYRDGTMFLRTSLDIISPAWISVISSADGTKAYELQPSPVVLAMRHGQEKVVKILISGI